MLEGRGTEGTRESGPACRPDPAAGDVRRLPPVEAFLPRPLSGLRAPAPRPPKEPPRRGDTCPRQEAADGNPLCGLIVRCPPGRTSRKPGSRRPGVWAGVPGPAAHPHARAPPGSEAAGPPSVWLQSPRRRPGLPQAGPGAIGGGPASLKLAPEPPAAARPPSVWPRSPTAPVRSPSGWPRSHRRRPGLPQAGPGAPRRPEAGLPRPAPTQPRGRPAPSLPAACPRYLPRLPGGAAAGGGASPLAPRGCGRLPSAGRPWPAPYVKRRRRPQRHSAEGGRRRAGSRSAPLPGNWPQRPANQGRAPYPSARVPGLHQRRPGPAPAPPSGGAAGARGLWATG
ncbi:uncharacterized protein LOC103792132 [Callithrix jacchus]